MPQQQMVIEVWELKEKAVERKNYFEQRGCTVSDTVSCSTATWRDGTPGGSTYTATDPLDGEVWVIIATKTPS